MQAGDHFFRDFLKNGGLERFLLIGAIAAAIAVTGFFWFQPDTFLIRYTSDDAFYYLQVARHIALGDGPTFDGLTWTTGVHPLYTLVLAASYIMTGYDSSGFLHTAFTINSLAFFLTAWFVYGLAQRLWNHRAGLWAAILWLSNAHAIILIFTGMEGSLAALCLSAFVCYSADSSPLPRPAGWWAGLGGVASICLLARTEFVLLVFPWMLAVVLLKAESIKRGAAMMAIAGGTALLPVAVWDLVIYRITGQLLQGSAEMKMIIREHTLQNNAILSEIWYAATVFQEWLLKCFVKSPLLKYLLFGLFISGSFGAVWKSVKGVQNRIRHWLVMGLIAAPVILGLVYAVLLPRTWTWYYAPALVLWTILTAALAASARDFFAHWGYTTSKLLLGVFVLFLGFGESYGYLTLKSVRGRDADHMATYEVSQWMKKNLPPDSRVGSWNSGLYSWYSGLQVVNLDGLINDEIAEWYKKGGSMRDYIASRKIDYLADGLTYMQEDCPTHVIPWLCPKISEERYETVYSYSGYGDELRVWKLEQ